MTGENGLLNAGEEAQRGDEALRAARHLLEGGFFNDAVSRAYYAAFHWARALLFLRGLEPKTHRGTVQLFGLHYIKAGPLTEETGGELAHLETYRELSDYRSSAHFSEEEAAQQIARAEHFVSSCRPVLESQIT